MRDLKCPNCGSRELLDDGARTTCSYCRSTFARVPEDAPTSRTKISLEDDVVALLQKCIDDPENRTRYASLVLDIDPTNQVAQRYL